MTEIVELTTVVRADRHITGRHARVLHRSNRKALLDCRYFVDRNIRREFTKQRRYGESQILTSQMVVRTNHFVGRRHAHSRNPDANYIEIVKAAGKTGQANFALTICSMRPFFPHMDACNRPPHLSLYPRYTPLGVSANHAHACGAGWRSKGVGLRILWIGKHPTDGAAGDEVYDRKTIAACRARGHSVDLFHPVKVGRMREVLNLASGVPHYRTRFASAANRSAIRGMSSAYDITICSWEPFDALALGLEPPGILILHNVTSRALPALFPGNMLAALGGARAGAWERESYRQPGFAALAALSRRDQRYLQGLPGHPAVMWTPPGMPPCVDLDADAKLVPEIVLSGTFDWIPKRRDLLLFAQEFAAIGAPVAVRAAGLPDQAMQQLKPRRPLTVQETGAALRFGLITDRFEAGHKLKTLAYIADNQIVLSFADIGDDFADIPDSTLFLRRVMAASDIEAHIRTLSDMPAAALRDRFLTFKRRCAEAFTWDGVATTLLETAAAIASRRC